MIDTRKTPSPSITPTETPPRPTPSRSTTPAKPSAFANSDADLIPLYGYSERPSRVGGALSGSLAPSPTHSPTLPASSQAPSAAGDDYTAWINQRFRHYQTALDQNTAWINQQLRHYQTLLDQQSELQAIAAQPPGDGGCFDRRLPGEPTFTLLARDPSAPHVVKQWAYERERAIARGEKPETDRAQVEQARQLARDMEAWRKANDGAWRA